jgi:hypothetical protein
MSNPVKKKTQLKTPSLSTERWIGILWLFVQNEQ